jgi:hypothetical protein
MGARAGDVLESQESTVPAGFLGGQAVALPTGTNERGLAYDSRRS